ncbi:MAG: hypothetical protein NVSMB38_41440 [Ktedonobacteraceae bacterium]
MEKKTAAINVTKALAGISLAVLAAVGGASGSILLAGLSAIPAAALANADTIGALLRRTQNKNDVVLTVSSPPWWIGNATLWQDICASVENKLPLVLHNLSQRLQLGQQELTTQAVRQAFTEELVPQLPQWDITVQERELLANYLAPQLMEKMAETLKSVIVPMQTDALLTNSQSAAQNSTEIVTILKQMIIILEKMRTEPPVPQSSMTQQQATTSPSTIVQQGATLDDVLEQKLNDNAYDVFICYNQDDVDGVRPIGKQLMTHGILPWFDEIDLQPGRPWMAQQEELVQKIPAAAVFIGKSGIAPWQQMQVYTFLEQFVWRRCPVIPVILTDVSGKPSLPPFLRNMAWVNFGKQAPDPLGQLIWGITGKRPRL